MQYLRRTNKMLSRFAFRLIVWNGRNLHTSVVCGKNLHTSCQRPIFVVEDTGRGHQVMDIYSRLLQERIITVFGGIDTHVSSTVIAQLLFLQADSSKKPIHMYINSPGGSVTAGLAIYDTMQFIPAPIHTWCVGEACSMGSLLVAAGRPGLRHSLPNARIMVHQPMGQTAGQATDILIHAEEIKNLKHKIIDIYVKHTGKSTEQIRQNLERDFFMSPRQAKEFGLIDDVLVAPIFEKES